MRSADTENQFIDDVVNSSPSMSPPNSKISRLCQVSFHLQCNGSVRIKARVLDRIKVVHAFGESTFLMFPKIVERRRRLAR